MNESGHFKGSKNHMSKRGSRIARRTIYAIALASIRTTRNGVAINPTLATYYKEKTVSKAKKVALGAVMHKVCNIIFAILRNNRPFKIISNEEHLSQHMSNKMVLRKSA